MCTGLVDAWSASIMLECRCWFPLSKWPNTTNEPTGFVGWNLIVWQNPWCSPWVMVQPQTQIVEIYEPFIPKSGEFYRCHRLTYTIHYHPLPSISIHYHPIPIFWCSHFHCSNHHFLSRPWRPWPGPRGCGARDSPTAPGRWWWFSGCWHPPVVMNWNPNKGYIYRDPWTIGILNIFIPINLL